MDNFRFGFHKTYDQSFRMFYLGPMGHISFHLHTTPDESTTKAAFIIKSSVSIFAEILGHHYQWLNVLQVEDWWGLCSRDKYAHLFEKKEKV